VKGKPIEMIVLFDFYGAVLTATQREFFDLYYNQDLSLGEIAENEGITRQGVRDAIRRAELSLSEMEEKLGLFRRYGNLDFKLTQINAAAGEIARINETGYSNADIDAHAQRILTATAPYIDQNQE